MIPVIMMKIHAILPISFESPKISIPIIAVPMAPIPVQIAYPVPIGIDFRAKESKYRLTIMNPAVITLGMSWVKPSVNFNPIAHPISIIPARTK